MFEDEFLSCRSYLISSSKVPDAHQRKVQLDVVLATRHYSNYGPHASSRSQPPAPSEGMAS